MLDGLTIDNQESCFWCSKSGLLETYSPYSVYKPKSHKMYVQVIRRMNVICSRTNRK